MKKGGLKKKMLSLASEDETPAENPMEQSVFSQMYSIRNISQS